jgi:micrococcal nuclease
LFLQCTGILTKAEMKILNCSDFRLISRYRYILAISLFLLFSINIVAQKYEGTIIRVIDGDTFIFLTKTGSLVVRMLGIDAPERDQPFSRESAQFLSKYLNKEAVAEINGTDKDDRYVGTLFVNGRNVNLLSIKEGFAWHYKRYSSDKDYAEAEEYAQKNKLNIWSLPNPIPPWTWRLRHTSYLEKEQDYKNSSER